MTTMSRGDLLVVAAYTPDELDHLNGNTDDVCPFWHVLLTPTGKTNTYDCDFGTKNVPTSHAPYLQCTVTDKTIAWSDTNVWTSIQGGSDTVMLFADANHRVDSHDSVRVVVKLDGNLTKAVQVCVNDGAIVSCASLGLSNDRAILPL